jgi:serine/threonine protein kinase
MPARKMVAADLAPGYNPLQWVKLISVVVSCGGFRWTRIGRTILFPGRLRREWIRVTYHIDDSQDPSEVAPMETTLSTPDPQPWPELTAAARTALDARYELLGEAGRGGMGVVYRARQRLLQREVALKVSLPGVPSTRFLREARLLAQLHSPQVVTVHDFDILPGGFPMLVMEWVEGMNLSQVIGKQNGPIQEDQATTWMRQTCEGMKAAADFGIVHRDLKPSNILIDPSGMARVADFGLARDGGAGDGGLHTLEGSTMGTPHYMAPEQAEDPHNVDTRADVYSFGATFYHALTGVTPFSGSTAFSILFKHKAEPLIPPRSRNPSISEHINEVIERCLAKSPNERFSSFAEISRQLDPASRQISPWEASEDAKLAPYLARYHVYRPMYLGAWNDMESNDLYEFPGRRWLRILHGDITDQQVDAIVSSDDAQLSMEGSIPQAILRVGGSSIGTEARKYAPVRLGRVVVTSAGSLSARFVFHGIALNSSKQELTPSRDLIAEIIASCMYNADTLGVTTIALPLLAIGGRFSEGVCLDTMFRYLARTLLRGLTSVQEARLVIFRRLPVEYRAEDWRQNFPG